MRVLQRSLALAVLTAAAVVSAQGCGAEPLPEDLCSFLRDDNSCLARFADDILDVDDAGANWCLARTYDPTSDPVASTNGFFQTRDDLATCIRAQGGLVILDPPPDPAAFPVVAGKFTMLDSKANMCAELEILAPLTFTLTVTPVDADNDSPNQPIEAATLEDDITGGTFASVTPPEGKNTVDVSCPGGLEMHHFNTALTALCPAEDTRCTCPEFGSSIPRAFIESSPGIPETPASSAVPGYVRAVVVFPPLRPDLVPVDPSADIPPEALPRAIEYFNCLIPAPPPPCENLVQDGDETDVDCGGSCATKCADELKCLKNSDCQSGDCSAPQGIFLCQPPPR